MDHRNRRRKRDRPHHTTANLSSSLSKRLRFPPPPPTTYTYRGEKEGDQQSFPSSSSSSSSNIVMVVGFPSDCTVMELKSRLETFGPVSRTRIDAASSTAYVSFRSGPAAEAAISASLDPTFGISIRSKKVIMCRAADPKLIWKSETGPAPSLNQLDRSIKKHSTTSSSITDASESLNKGREIVAYDDLF